MKSGSGLLFVGRMTYLFGLTHWTPQFFLGLESLFGLVELRLSVLLGAAFFLVREIETAKRIVFHDRYVVEDRCGWWERNDGGERCGELGPINYRQILVSRTIFCDAHYLLRKLGGFKRPLEIEGVLNRLPDQRPLSSLLYSLAAVREPTPRENNAEHTTPLAKSLTITHPT